MAHAVQDAVSSQSRVAVRSGGHCLEGFVADPAVRSLIDMTRLRGVEFDERRRSFAVGAGTDLGTLYEMLFKRWGVTVPGGVCPQVGAGGHISGGGYGALSRRFGLVVDHLEAVEVVTVDHSGRARVVIAEADPSGRNHDLWWAHTGGGGGNFGVVTRYWLRDPAASRLAAPDELLPIPPRTLTIRHASWPWTVLDTAAYGRVVDNFVRWHEQHSKAGTPETGVFATLWLNSVTTGDLVLIAQADDAALLDDFVAAVGDGVPAPTVTPDRTLPWWDAFRYSSFADFGRSIGQRIKDKSSYLRAGFRPAQLIALVDRLADGTPGGVGATVLLAGHGGAVNQMAPASRAIPHRDSVVKVQYSVSWADPADDAIHLDWIRRLYRDVFASTGGVPVPDAVSDGAYINYPDTDLADATWNTSAVAWSHLYYKDNYRRLQKVKRAHDPLDIFHHALSVRPR
ncbi:FAD-binding protein [Flexivirga sp. ID2601S]|uniref:FAD-binding protein n=1 Tax=Flexivirga aerilata TaxID=1656889 RepID=A0A849AG80_9MICO|nr:FAD-binding protein [Flexivirga aerilata]